MPTTEQTIEVSQDSSMQSRSENSDRTPKSSRFIFDAALSTAVIANGQDQTVRLSPTAR